MAECRHGLSEDCPGCVQDTIEALLAEVAELKRHAQCALDTERLDWLDKVNTATNERVGTCYGWKFDINHNRASLSDHNLPALHVRAAIDAARGYAVTSTDG